MARGKGQMCIYHPIKIGTDFTFCFLKVALLKGRKIKSLQEKKVKLSTTLKKMRDKHTIYKQTFQAKQNQTNEKKAKGH